MRLYAFSLYDTKASYFHTPFFMHHRGLAIRAVIDLGTNLDTTVGRHPADYALFELGEFDDQTGALISQAPVNLGLVATFLPAPQPVLFHPAQEA